MSVACTAPDEFLASFTKLLSAHLDDEEAWLQETRARLAELRDAVAEYDLRLIADCLDDQRDHEQQAATLHARRPEFRRAMSRITGLPPEQATLGNLLPHLPAAEARQLRKRRHSLRMLAQEVGETQQQVQRLVLHVHSISQAMLCEVLGVNRDGSRYAADGGLDLRQSRPLMDVRT